MKTRIILAGIAIVLIATLALTVTPKKEPLRGSILPHHNLVGKNIDGFYESIADEAVERIILLAPNHFNLGHYFIQSTRSLDREVALDLEMIDALVAQNALGVESLSLSAEHGLMVHIERIQRFFPDAKVVPIMIKWKTPQKNLDALIAELSSTKHTGRTLIIASIDFSHYVSEETAKQNDARTIAWLEKWSQGQAAELSDIWELEKSTAFDTEIATAMDSPEALYLFTKLLSPPRKLQLWERTSSLVITGMTDPMQGTSHLFVKVW